MNKNQQSPQVLKRTAIAAAALLVCSGAQAQTSSYSFGTQISSQWQTTFQPSETFATLSVTTTDNMNYIFDLATTANFNALFGTPNATIHRLVFNTNNVDPLVGSVRLASGSWGVDHIYYSPSNTELGGVTFDFMEGWGNPSTSGGSLLQSNERVVWETSFASPTSFVAPPFALKVFGLGDSGSGHAWYVPASPVPEPETYAMLLAGLGMLGFAARRRKQKEAAAT